MDEAIVEAIEHGWPLTKDEMVMERAQREAEYRWSKKQAEEIPQFEVKPVQSLGYAFGYQVLKFAENLVKP